MRYHFIGLLLIVALCAVAGCTKKQHGVSSSVQGDMDSVGQWNVLANHVANRINNELIRQNYLNATVYVRHSCGRPGKCGSHESFPFDEGFNDLLTTQLVNFGINTVRTPESASLAVDYKVQAVYQPSDYQSSGHYEVIITTSILDKNRYVMHSSDIYYIDNADYWHYRLATPAAEIRLTGSHKPVPPSSTQKKSL